MKQCRNWRIFKADRIVTLKTCISKSNEESKYKLHLTLTHLCEYDVNTHVMFRYGYAHRISRRSYTG